MSLELLLATVAWTDDTQFDRDGAVDLLNQAFDDAIGGRLTGALDLLDPHGVLDVHDDDDPTDDAVRTQLREQLARQVANVNLLYRAVTGDSRFGDASTLRFGPWTLLNAGGDSAGDPPGPTFNAINDLPEQVLAALGFSWPAHGTL